SRETLDVPGETLVPVPPLSMPARDEAAGHESLIRSEAVQLFLDRARSSAPDFAASQFELSAIAKLCRRLDGMPLAIELAAARTRLLAVDQILERLEDRFRLLTEGGRTRPARHRTLRAAIDWSYDLLPEAEQRLFARLSIFAGGWTLAEAESVCAEDDLGRSD